ncbi:MAG: hypothetical protein JO266_17130 [Acidobacteria bacterium]|nr:hypothetical protein [Acidobacteriota bacterium]
MENTFSPSWQREARDEVASVITSLEPDQLSAAKAEHHYPRRRLRRLEIVLFWALRIYLIFMFGVVLYQISKSVR